MSGERVVLLITDGKATCKEDPEDALAELRESNIEVTLNIVGFALDDEALKEQMRGWAGANGGSYFDAGDAGSLTEAIVAAVAAPVAIYALGDDAAPVATTTVGAPPVELAPGEYRVEVRADPSLTFDSVVIEPGAVETLELPITAEE